MARSQQSLITPLYGGSVTAVRLGPHIFCAAVPLPPPPLTAKSQGPSAHASAVAPILCVSQENLLSPPLPTSDTTQGQSFRPKGGAKERGLFDRIDFRLLLAPPHLCGRRCVPLRSVWVNGPPFPRGGLPLWGFPPPPHDPKIMVQIPLQRPRTLDM